MRGMTGGGSQLNGTARTQSLPIRPADSLSSRVPHQAKNTPKSHGVVQAIAGWRSAGNHPHAFPAKVPSGDE